MHNPNFSSGPCSKRPGWNFDVLKDAALGRSHRSSLGRKKLAQAISLTKKILQIPDEYLVGIMPASDTGAFEAAMWTLLGPRPVTVLVWESFSEGWASDIEKQLKLNPRIIRADYGDIPDLDNIGWGSDVVFVANGTTSGVKIPHWDWIPLKRDGLSLCDATSAVFAMPIDWRRVDVLTFSWQKCLGGEGAHGMIVLSPQAVERMESYDPPWPLPKIFRMKKGGKLDRTIFEGDTINTPSMLCVEDYLDALAWADKVGLNELFERSLSNLRVIEEWVDKTPWIEFLARSKDIRSHTSVCLVVINETLKSLSRDKQEIFLKSITAELEGNNIAHDIISYRDAPLGFRFWCGPSINADAVKTAVDELSKVYNRKALELKQNFQKGPAHEKDSHK